MFKRKGRHAAPRGRLVGPLFALEALMITYAAKREFDTVMAAQLAEIARGGAL